MSAISKSCKRGSKLHQKTLHINFTLFCAIGLAELPLPGRKRQLCSIAVGLQNHFIGVELPYISARQHLPGVAALPPLGSEQIAMKETQKLLTPNKHG